MAKSTSYKNAYMLLIFNNTAYTLLGDANGLAATGAPGSLYVSLHTADPTAGDQTTSEAAYTDYARVAVARSGAGWTVAANAVSNAAAVTFPACTGSTAACTYFGVGTSATAAGKLMYSGLLTAQLDVSNGITPEFAIGDLDIDES